MPQITMKVIITVSVLLTLLRTPKYASVIMIAASIRKKITMPITSFLNGEIS